MRTLNARKWSTTVAMGPGIFAAMTGLLMFLVGERLFKSAHELVAIGFSVAIVLHVSSNLWSFRQYSSRQGGASIVTLAWATGIGLVMTSAPPSTGEAEVLVDARIGSRPIARLVPLVAMELGVLPDRLRDGGYAIGRPGMSVRQLADHHGADIDDILLSVFRWRGAGSGTSCARSRRIRPWRPWLDSRLS